MSIFDRSSNVAVQRYELDNDGYIEIGYDEDPERPIVGEYRLLTGDDKPIAVGSWERGDKRFIFGDESLWDEFRMWQNINELNNHEDKIEYLTDDESISEDDAEEFLEGEPPYCIEIKGYSQGDACFVYFPSDTKDTEEERQDSAQLLANYIFGDIYIAEYCDPETGETKLSYSIEDYKVGENTTRFIDGQMSSEEAVEYVKNILSEY